MAKSGSQWKPRDVAVLILSLTVSVISITAVMGAVFFGSETGRLEELVAFLLGSMTTIIGEYVLLQLKQKDDKPCDPFDGVNP